MSNKYKFKDQTKLYFVTLTVVYWIDVFLRNEYKNLFLDEVRHSQKGKGLEVYAWVIMTSHIHMIIGTKDMNMENIMRDLKGKTSKQLNKLIKNNVQESRREWMLWLMERAGKRNSQNVNFQFWYQDSHPIELFDNEIMQQKLDYIHNNPVEAGFVDSGEQWLYSSARDYCGIKGLLDIELIK